MKRMLLLAPLFLMTASTAAADYLLIKININQLDFLPPALINPAGGVGGMGGGVPMPPGGGVPMPPGGGAPMPPADPNAKWVQAYVEFYGEPKFIGQTQLGGSQSTIWKYDHKWGNGSWLTFSSHFPITIERVPKDTYSADFDVAFKKEMKEKGKKDSSKSVEGFLHMARKALARGRLNDFKKALEEAEKIDPKDNIVASCIRVRNALKKTPTVLDPTQADLIAELPTGYKPYTLKKYYPKDGADGHYRIYAQVFETDNVTQNVIKRRLKMMENTLQTFYYWFALQGNASPQPALPKHPLIAVMTKNKEEFLTRHLQWGGQPMVADGFTPRRENVIIMSAKARLNDPRFDEFDAILTTKLAEVNGKLQQYINTSVTREDLLSSTINNQKGAGNFAIFLAAAETAVVVSRAMEDEAERATITNEAVRQLLIASEIFPRNVQIPDWMVEGLAAFFETPMGAVYPTVGTPSWTHLISFKYLRNVNKWDDKDKKPEVLYNVILDRYFQDARQLSAKAQTARDNPNLRRDAAKAWELARCTAWAYVFHLAENRQLDLLFNYGKELDKLPRDLDLNDAVLETCFAKGFKMTEQNTRQIDGKQFVFMADAWFDTMQRTNLDLGDFQTKLMQQRELQDADPATLGSGLPVGITPPVAPPVTPPMPVQPPPGAPPGQTPPVQNPPIMNPPVMYPQRPPGMRPPGVRPPPGTRPPVRPPVRPPG